MSFHPLVHFFTFLFPQKWLPNFIPIEVSREKKEVIGMEVKLKDRLQRNGLFGMIKNVETFYQRITKKISVKASGVTAASPTLYEISEAYKTHQIEVERKRSQALQEVQRRTFLTR